METTKKQSSERITLTISNMNPYPSKTKFDEKGRRVQRLSFEVSGSDEAVAQYVADQKASNPEKEFKLSDNGKPMFHMNEDTHINFGADSIVRIPNDEGGFDWIVDVLESKTIDEKMAKIGGAVASLHASNRYNQVIGRIQELEQLKKNKASAYARLQTKSEGADLNK